MGAKAAVRVVSQPMSQHSVLGAHSAFPLALNSVTTKNPAWACLGSAHHPTGKHF